MGHRDPGWNGVEHKDPRQVLPVAVHRGPGGFFRLPRGGGVQEYRIRRIGGGGRGVCRLPSINIDSQNSAILDDAFAVLGSLIDKYDRNCESDSFK